MNYIGIIAASILSVHFMEDKVRIGKFGKLGKWILVKRVSISAHCKTN